MIWPWILAAFLAFAVLYWIWPAVQQFDEDNRGS
jgi:hypothetical protein